MQNEDYSVIDKRNIEEAIVNTEATIKSTKEKESLAGSNKERIGKINTRALTEYDTTYKLEEFEKNYLMIFNQENLEGYHMPRLGTEKDVEALRYTFSKFGFEIIEFKDLTKEEVLRELSVFAEKDFTNYGCIAVAVLTHGSVNGLLRARDFTFNEIDIINYFESHNKSTVTKPKILIVQACRGYEMDPGVEVNERYNDRIRTDVDEDLEQYYTLPAESDILILHSAYAGRVSHRNTIRGSWFIQTLCQKIEQLASELDLESIITEVKHEVAIEYVNKDIRAGTISKQMPVQTSTLIRKLYLRKFGDTPIHSVEEDFLSRICFNEIRNRYEQEQSTKDEHLCDILNSNERGNTTNANQELLDQACSLYSDNSQYKINPKDIEPVALVWTNKLKSLDTRQRLLAEKEVNDVLFKFELENLEVR